MAYLVKPMSYVLVIILGYTLKRVGFLNKSDQQTLSKVMFNITLPCAIIQGFSGWWASVLPAHFCRCCSCI